MLASLSAIRDRSVARLESLRLRARRLGGDRRGSVAVEFAIVALPLVGIALVALQAGLYYFAGQYLESVTEKAGRLILTGQAQSQNLTKAQFASAVCQNITALFSCSGVMVDVTLATTFASANTGAPTLTYDSNGNVTNTWSYAPGSQGDIVVLRVMYQWPVLNPILGFNLANLSNGQRLLMATAVFRNEPY